MQRKVCEMYQIYVARLNYIVCSVLHLAARLHPWQVRNLFTESILILGPKHIFFFIRLRYTWGLIYGYGFLSVTN